MAKAILTVTAKIDITAASEEVCVRAERALALISLYARLFEETPTGELRGGPRRSELEHLLDATRDAVRGAVDSADLLASQLLRCS